MISKKVFRMLIKEKGWKPYIKYRVLNLNTGKGHVIWSFLEHDSFECQFKNGEKPQGV